MASPSINMGSGGSAISSLLKDGYVHLAGINQAVMKNIEACQDIGKVLFFIFW